MNIFGFGKKKESSEQKNHNLLLAGKNEYLGFGGKNEFFDFGKRNERFFSGEKIDFSKHLFFSEVKCGNIAFGKLRLISRSTTVLKKKFKWKIFFLVLLVFSSKWTNFLVQRWVILAPKKAQKKRSKKKTCNARGRYAPPPPTHTHTLQPLVTLQSLWTAPTRIISQSEKTPKQCQCFLSKIASQKP